VNYLKVTESEKTGCSRFDSVRSMVELHDRKGLFQPKLQHDLFLKILRGKKTQVFLYPTLHTLFVSNKSPTKESSKGARLKLCRASADRKEAGITRRRRPFRSDGLLRPHGHTRNALRPRQGSLHRTEGSAGRRALAPKPALGPVAAPGQSRTPAAASPTPPHGGAA